MEAKFTHSDNKAAGAKYPRIREHIRKQILAGELPSGMRLPPELKYAKRFGVNKNTISRALADLVREGLVVRRSGSGTYVAGDRKPIFPGRHLQLALLWDMTVDAARLMNSFQGAITRGILNRWGLDTIEPSFTHLDRKRWGQALWQAPQRGVSVTCLCPGWSNLQHYPPLDPIRSGHFDGLITIAINEEDWLEKLLGTGLPTVMVDYPNERFSDRADLVHLDPLPAYRKAVSALVKQGLRRIHYVGFMMTTSPKKMQLTKEEFRAFCNLPQQIEPDSLLREAAYRVGMAENQCPVQEAWVHREVSGRESCSELARRLLALPPDQRPEAVVCMGVHQAHEIMQVFADHGQPLIGVGAGTQAYTGPAWPLLLDPAEVGHAAASLMLTRLQQPQTHPIRMGVPIRFKEMKQTRANVPDHSVQA